jgi:hypothetical protein
MARDRFGRGLLRFSAVAESPFALAQGKQLHVGDQQFLAGTAPFSEIVRPKSNNHAVA